MSRVVAVCMIASFSVLAPLLEGSLGGGRGWLLGFLIIILLPAATRAGGPRFHPLDPELAVPLMYFLSAGYSPLLHRLTARDFALNTAEINAVQVSYVGAVTCALVCAALSRAPKEAITAAISVLPERILPRDWAVIATGMAGAIMVIAFIATTGLSTLMTASYADTYTYEQGKGVLVAGWYVIQLAIVHCVARIADFRRVGKKVPAILYASGIVWVMAFSLNTVLGKRGPILWVLLSSAFCLHVSGFKIRRIWMVLAAGLIVIYSFAVEGYRTQLGQGAEKGLEAAQSNLERIDNPAVINELEVVFSNLVIVVNEDPPIVTYPGESWVNAFLILIPKPIWRERPLSMSYRFVQWYSPSMWASGGGLAFNATAEGFVNMGEVGVIVEIALFTALFFFGPIAVCLSKLRDPLWRALACSMASFTYYQYRGELAGLLKIDLAVIFAALIVLLVDNGFILASHQLKRYDPGSVLKGRSRPG